MDRDRLIPATWSAATVSGGLEPAAYVERRGHVLVVTMNRPRVLNAVDVAMADLLGAAWAELDEDPDLRVGILTGSGRAFCSGADLQALGADSDLHATGHPEWGFAGVTRHPIGKPVIAAVNGLAVGGGAEIVLACDLTVAARGAWFSLPEVRRGLFAKEGGVLRLPHQIPRRVALELLLTGDSVDADRAQDLGLVNTVVEPDRLLEEALGLADRIAANAPIAVRETKRLVAEFGSSGSAWTSDTRAVTDRAFEAIRETADAAEGAQAFAEARPAEWKGR